MNAVRTEEIEMKADLIIGSISLQFITEPVIKKLKFKIVSNFDFITILNNALSHTHFEEIYQYWVLFPMFAFALRLYNSKRFMSLAIMLFAIFEIFFMLSSFNPYGVMMSLIGIGAVACSLFNEFMSEKLTTQDSKDKRNKVLLVDDDENYINLCKRYLEGIGYKVETAQNGLHAFALAREDQFNLIIMDIQMPIMNGQMASEFLKKDARTKNFPIVGMSSSTTLELNMKHFKDKFSKSQGMSIIGKRIHQWVEG